MDREVKVMAIVVAFLLIVTVTVSFVRFSDLDSTNLASATCSPACVSPMVCNADPADPYGGNCECPPGQPNECLGNCYFDPMTECLGVCRLTSQNPTECGDQCCASPWSCKSSDFLGDYCGLPPDDPNQGGGGPAPCSVNCGGSSGGGGGGCVSEWGLECGICGQVSCAGVCVDPCKDECNPLLRDCGDLTSCGDGETQKPNNNSMFEQCDDGNNENGDGCSRDCKFEENWCLDFDGDNFGNSSVEVSRSYEPFGYVSNCEDCNDSDPLFNLDCTPVPASNLIWRNLLFNSPTIMEAQDLDTVLMDSSNAGLAESSVRDYLVWEEDSFQDSGFGNLVDDTVSGYPTSSTQEILEHLIFNTETYLENVVPVDGDHAEFYFKVESFDSLELKTHNVEFNSPSSVAITSIANADNSLQVYTTFENLLTISPGSEVLLKASAWDEDDFLDVNWTVDGDKFNETKHFAEFFDADYSSLDANYTFEDEGKHIICVSAVGEKRGEKVEDCITIEVLCGGICVNAVISSPIGQVDTTWVRFDARNSTVYNCSNDLTSYDFMADIGDAGCVYIHNKTQLGDDLEMSNKGNLGITYSLKAEWFLDGKSFGPAVMWDEHYPNEYGYPYIFDWFFSDIDWHEARLSLTYEEIIA